MASARIRRRNRRRSVSAAIDTAKTEMPKLKEEYDALSEGDPGREVLMNKMKGLASSVKNITSDVESKMTKAGSTEVLKFGGTFDKMYSDFASEYSEMIGLEEGSDLSVGIEYTPGTPEYIARAGEEEAQTKLDVGIERGVAASEEQIERGLGAIGEGAAAAKKEFEIGEAKTLEMIAGGKEEAIGQIGAGRERMEQAWEEGMTRAGEKLDPYAQAGERALGKYETAMGIGGGEFDPSTLEDLPGYQMRLKQGLESVKGAAAARGGALGGRALRELQSRGEGIASQEFGRYVAGLSDITGKGFAAASTLANIGMQGAQGKAGAAQFASAAEAGITMDATGKSIAAVGMGTTGRAGVEMSAASAEAALYGQNASTMASLYGTQATTGAGMAMSLGMQQSQMQWQRMEADLARQMAKWQGGQQMFGSFLSLAGTVGGAMIGGPTGAAVGGQVASSVK